MNAKKSLSNPGPLFIVFIVFLVLKLVDAIDWSWWWITAPLWGPLAVSVPLFMLAGLFIGVGEVLEWCERKQ